MDCIENSTEKWSMVPYYSNIGADFNKDKVPDLNLNKGIQFSNRLPRSKSCSSNPSAIVSFEEAIENELKHGKLKSDPDMDMKKLRRTISNRLSAQRSRGRKTQYIFDMEKKVELLLDTISVLSPQVQSYKEKRELLSLEKDSLQLEVDRLFKNEKLHEMELEKRKLEIKRLRELKKYVNNITHDPNHGPRHVLGSSSILSQVQVYPNLNFYQRRLQNLQKFENLKKLSESEQCGTEDQLSIFATKKYDDSMKQEKNQDEGDIDKYLDFNAIYVDLSDD